MNIQHSHRSDEWGTPGDVMEAIRDVLGIIDLDPASDAYFNQVVRAQKYYTKEEDGLNLHWLTHPSPTCCTVYVNPPGGKTGNKSNTVLFWDKLMLERDAKHIRHAIFMGFSLECLQTTQSSKNPILDFPFCVPSKRLRFTSKNGTYNAPSHSNVIVYVPGFVDQTEEFLSEMSRFGACVCP